MVGYARDRASSASSASAEGGPPRVEGPRGPGQVVRESPRRDAPEPREPVPGRRAQRARPVERPPVPGRVRLVAGAGSERRGGVRRVVVARPRHHVPHPSVGHHPPPLRRCHRAGTNASGGVRHY